jgi:hypothetical protein
MEIKVGEYVRTKKGKIFKYGKGRAYLGKDNEIVNHSKNIIDLIEEGDYVNEQKVLCLKKNNDNCRDDIGTSYIEGIDIYLGYDESDIKTILTHEQYERTCYRLGDN